MWLLLVTLCSACHRDESMGNTIMHTTDCNDEKVAEQTLTQAYAVS